MALVVADVSNPFFTQLIDAVESAAYDWGYSLLLCNSDENFERERPISASYAPSAATA